ncbi:MAG: SIMPL domain-containing protein, partial [Vicinamibacterales bacterium]
ISVKGFSEKEVKSDLVIWSIKLRVASNDLQEGSKSINNSKNKISSFLTRNGIDQSEIIQRDLMVNDRQANEYEPASNLNNFRYVIEETIEVYPSGQLHIAS